MARKLHSPELGEQITKWVPPLSDGKPRFGLWPDFSDGKRELVLTVRWDIRNTSREEILTMLEMAMDDFAEHYKKES